MTNNEAIGNLIHTIRWNDMPIKAVKMTDEYLKVIITIIFDQLVCSIIFNLTLLIILITRK